MSRRPWRVDFSHAMHRLGEQRLGSLATRARFVVRDFKEPAWSEELGSFDCVVTVQAVHELRHKRHATSLHAAVRDVLALGGCYLVCDHFVGDGGMTNEHLFMSVAEQREALERAGFADVTSVLCKGGLVLHRAS